MSWLMSQQHLIELGFWTVTAICWVAGGWVIRDSFKEHRWWKFEQQLKIEYQLLELDGWPFYDGRGS